MTFYSGVMSELEKVAGEAPKFKILKQHTVPLTPEERSLVLARKAVWNFNGRGPSPAVWKSVVNGKTWFITNTHRAYNVRPTVQGAISRYHRFIKSTA